MADEQVPNPPTGLDAETVERLNATLNSLNDSIAAKPAAPPVATDTDEAEELGNLDPDTAKLVNKLVTKGLAKVEEKLTRSYTQDQAIRAYNQKLAQEFPDLANPNSALSKATVTEIKKRVAENPRYTEDVPSAVYDAACAAAIALNKGKAPVAPVSAEERRISTISGGYMPAGRPAPAPAKPEEITQEQEYMAARLNVPKEAYSGFVGHVDDKGAITMHNPKAAKV